METPALSLTALGWKEQRQDACPAGTVPARVAAVDRDLFVLMDQHGSFRAKLAGAWRHHHHETGDIPCVGDWVCVDRQPGDGIGMIQALLPRDTLLRRKAPGDAARVQMIAANVDVVMVVQSCHFDFNVKRLERYLVMVREGGAEPIVLLTKTDLVPASELAQRLAEIRAAGIACPVLTLSNITREGIDELLGSLQPGRTYCFVGSSGVGKSTLINHLTDSAEQETGGVSATGEGRHTTVRRELILLRGGALVIDNPGMREFGVLDAEAGLDNSFADIVQLATACRYRDCTHAAEPGCAVQQGLTDGTLDSAHYENYLKLRQESAFHEMSHAERRRKDREFGKLVKSVKQSLDDVDNDSPPKKRR